MEIEKTVSINTQDTPIMTARAEEPVVVYDVPVARANALAFVILQRIYASHDETNQEDRAELISCIERFKNQTNFSGSSNTYHNFSVELARRDEYGLACDILEVGLDRRRGGFSRDCDLLADYLQYGVNCGRTKEAKKYFKDLMGIPRRRWTWRGFSFVVHFLQNLEERGELDNSIRQIISSIDCSRVEYDKIDSLEPFEKAMLALSQEFKSYKPDKEDPYEIEAQIYEYLGDEKRALEVLKQAENTVISCPKCALRRADLLYELGDYSTASISINRALTDAVQTQSSVNEGYLHYLFSLCAISNARKNQEELTEELVDTIYNHFNKALLEFEDGRQSQKDIIRRNARNIQDETGIAVPEKYIRLSSLIED